MAKAKTTRAELLALAMARGLTLADAARSLSINERTARRWAEAPGFDGQVDALRRRLIDDTIGKLAGLAGKAAAKFEQLMETGSPTVQLGSAKAIMANLIEIQAHADMARRLAELEAIVNAKP